MYQMTAWQTTMNTILPNAAQLVKPLQNVTYTTPAIMCGDAPDATANDTMETVFKIIVETSQNLSHMCTCMDLSCSKRATLNARCCRCFSVASGNVYLFLLA